MNLFNLDSKFMQFADKFANLMWLNFLTLICCLPIITIGASLTAMHNVLLKIYHDEDTYIANSFFKAFKKNLKQSTIIWIIYLAIIVVVVLDFIIIRGYAHDIPSILQYGLIIFGVLVAFSLSWVFILQSRYENRVLQTIKNSFYVSFMHIVYSVMLIILSIIPALCISLFSIGVPLVIAFGFTVPGILQTMLYSKVFDKLEEVDRKAQSDGTILESKTNNEEEKD